MRRDANWLGRVKTYLRILLSLFICLSSSFFPPSCVSLALSLSSSLILCLSFFLLRRETRTQERREIEHFKSRWRFPWQAPPSLDPHWFLNDNGFPVFSGYNPSRVKEFRRAWSFKNLIIIHLISIRRSVRRFAKSKNEFSFFSYLHISYFQRIHLW